MLQEYGARLNVIGNIELLTPSVREAVYKAQDLTRDNDRYVDARPWDAPA